MLAPPASVIGHTDRVDAVRSAVSALPGLSVVGSWLAGGGVAQVVADALAETDRVRSAVLWRRAPDGPERPWRGGAMPVRTKRAVFSYPVPVCVVVEDGLVTDVVVIDETEVAGCALVEGDPADLSAAVAAATDGQSWPSWRFGW